MLKVLYAVVAVTALLFMTPVARAEYKGNTACGKGGLCQSEAREWTSTNCSYQNNCFGRCGPGCSTYFGNTTTTACKNHDQCIKTQVCGGKSAAAAHTNCAAGLASAAKSLIGTHWNNKVKWVKSNLMSAWRGI